MFITRETRCQRAAEQGAGKRAGAVGSDAGTRAAPSGWDARRPGAAGGRREPGDPPGAEHTGLKRLKEHEIKKYKFNTSDELESFPSGKH